MNACTAPARKRLPLRTMGLCVAAPAVLLGGGLLSSTAAAETRGYAISLIHTATYADKGNCPKGGNGSTTEIHERSKPLNKVAQEGQMARTRYPARNRVVREDNASTIGRTRRGDRPLRTGDQDDVVSVL